MSRLRRANLNLRSFNHCDSGRGAAALRLHASGVAIAAEMSGWKHRLLVAALLSPRPGRYGVDIAKDLRMSKSTLVAGRPFCQSPRLQMLGLLVAVAAVGCETSPSEKGSNAGAGGLTDNTGEGGGRAVSTGGTGGVAGGTGGVAGGAQTSMNICQMTVDQFCRMGTAGKTCPRSWPGADDLLTTCPGLTYGRVFTEDCGAFLALVDAGVDTTVRYYYDTVTRELTAITFHYSSPIGPTCIAGPIGANANSFPASCPALSELVTCPR